MPCAPVTWLAPLLATPPRLLSSGCPAGSDGIVPCDPGTLRQRAESALGRSISLDAYSIARNIASEAGPGKPAERVAVAEAAINRARLDGLSISGLVMRNGASYARQSGTNPRVSSSQDPTATDVTIAELVLSGQTDNFARGATHYFAPKYYSTSGIKDLYDRWTSNWGHPSVGLAWVGPLPGVRPREQFFFRPVSKSDPYWRAAYGPGLAAALSGTEPAEQPCQRSGSGGMIAAVVGLAALGGAAWYLWRGR